jgi:uncharacterized protein (DUF4415 family)
MKKTKPENIKKEDWDDVNSPPLSDDLLSTMGPVRKTHPHMPPRVRGAQKSPVKIPVSLRLDESIINAFRSSGRGWQSRVNAALHEWLENHTV